MTDRPTFRYPRSGPLIARLLQFLGHGPKSWPAPRRLSASTLKRIAADEPTAQSLDEFVDVALELLVAPGRWRIETFAALGRDEVIARLRDGLRAYDRAVSELNADADLADPRHALPILVLVAVRIGAFFGVHAAAHKRDLGELWRETLALDAFPRAITSYAERALPDTPWRERGEACGVSRNTLDSWRSHPPGQDFKCSSLKKFADWAGTRIAGEDPAKIEWRLRWLVAASRIRAALDQFLGRDAAGTRWVERLLRTIQIHAGVNAAAFADTAGIAAVTALLEPAALAKLPDELVRVLRRMFAFIAGQTAHYDPTAGPELTPEQLELLRGAMLTDEEVRRHVWTYLGGLHALGLWSPGFLADVEQRGVAIEQYTVQLHEPAQYLRVQHFLVRSILAGADNADRDLAFSLHMPLTPAETASLAELQHRGLNELLADPHKFRAHLAVYERLQALQREHAGLARAELPPLDADTLPAELREFAGVLDLQRGLAVAVKQGEAEALALVERTMQVHPDLIDPALLLLRRAADMHLEQFARCCALTATIQGYLDAFGRLRTGLLFGVYRDMLPLRRQAREVTNTALAAGDLLAGKFVELVERAGDDWTVTLAYIEFLTRHAAIALVYRESWAPATAERATLRGAAEALAELHAARPDHPEPCLWLARAHATLGERSDAQRWARLAEQRGEPRGLAALAVFDEKLAKARAAARADDDPTDDVEAPVPCPPPTRPRPGRPLPRRC